jgi:hypothetical protein
MESISCEHAKDLALPRKQRFMAHRLRFALKDGLSVLAGKVEADETLIGGNARNMHLDKRERRIIGTGGKDQTAVMGMLQGGGKV